MSLRRLCQAKGGVASAAKPGGQLQTSADPVLANRTPQRTLRGIKLRIPPNQEEAPGRQEVVLASEQKRTSSRLAQHTPALENAPFAFAKLVAGLQTQNSSHAKSLSCPSPSRQHFKQKQIVHLTQFRRLFKLTYLTRTEPK